MSELSVLQALRMKGRATPGQIATAAGEEEARAGEILASMTARGLAEHKGERFRLSPVGREALAVALAGERPTLDGAELDQLHEQCVALNGPFKELASRSQNGGVVGEQLDMLHEHLVELLVRLEAAVPRTGRYRPRFERAIAELHGGDRSWFLGPLIDSYHTVWFELHEELIALTGRTREAEAAAGRAQ